MPKLGDVRLDVVYSEDTDKNVKTSDKPIERGLYITDHVEKEPEKLKISGVCVGVDANTRIEQLKSYQNKGERLVYIGRFKMTEVVIESFSVTKDKDVAEASFKFSIGLKQIIVVNSKSYESQKPATNAGYKPPISGSSTKRTHTVKQGETLSHYALWYYGSAKEKYWMKIYEANRPMLKSPHRIYPGQVIIIP